MMTKIPESMYSIRCPAGGCPVILAVMTDWQMSTKDPICMTLKRYLIQNIPGNMTIKYYDQ